jgi:hypothetical protein
MTKFKLVNPHIEGNIDITVKAKSELKAAGKMYETVLAPLFLTSAPKFNFTIKSDKKFYHFTVNESVNGDKAKYRIHKFNGKVDNTELNEKLNYFKEQDVQDGGKHKHKHKDDSSSSSSDSDSPPFYSISRYYYSPYIYTPIVPTTVPVTFTIPVLSPVYLHPYTYYLMY